MTRMERRRRRQRQMRRRVALFGTVLVMMTAAISAVVAGPSDKRPEQKLAEASQTGAPVETALPVVEPVELVYKTKIPEIAEPVAVEDPEEPEKIEQALLEQGYLHEEVPLDYDLQCHLIAVCDEYEVPYEIALGVIQAESSFTADASNGTCFGYMQINKINAEWLREDIGVTDLTDPYQNIRSGVYILSDLYADYGDWHKALIAYNYGPSGAQEHVFSKGYTTTSYSRTVMSYAESWAEVIKA